MSFGNCNESLLNSQQRTTHDDTMGNPPSISSFNASESTILKYKRVVKQNEARKASFHCWDGSDRVLMGAITNEDIKPDAPSISPLKRSRVAADSPMREPPISPSMGLIELSDMS